MSPPPPSSPQVESGAGASSTGGRVLRMAAACLLALAAYVLSEGSLVALGAIASPVFAALLALAIWTLSLRAWTTILIFLVLALDRGSDAHGVWRTPLSIINDLLTSNLDAVVPAFKGVKFTVIEMLSVALILLESSRKRQRSGAGSRPLATSAKPARLSLVILLAGVAVSAVNGLATGGNPQIAIWQSRPYLDTALFYVLFRTAFNTLADFVLLAKVVIVSALAKAALATYVAYVVAPTIAVNWEYATNHGDSILFAVAFAIPIVDFMERTDSRRLLQCALLLPPLALGMIANNRRLVWVELGVSLLVIYAASGPRPWKRTLKRALIVLAFPLLIYVSVGWSSPSGAFRPVRILRSMVDTNKDRSSWNRQVENYNIIMSLKPRAVLGLGFGKEWTEFFAMDNILQFFPMYHAEPHNQVLGTLLFMGPFGFTAVFGFFATTILLAVRSCRFTRDPVERAAALGALACVMASMLQAYGDLGPYFIQYKIFVALAATVAGKLAVATGAYQPAPLRP